MTCIYIYIVFLLFYHYMDGLSLLLIIFNVNNECSYSERPWHWMISNDNNISAPAYKWQRCHLVGITEFINKILKIFLLFIHLVILIYFPHILRVHLFQMTLSRSDRISSFIKMDLGITVIAYDITNDGIILSLCATCVMFS